MITPNRLLSRESSAGINKRQLAALVLLWVIATAILLLFRPGYTFPPFEVVDSWFYDGYQWDLRNQVAEFGPMMYVGSRLSWILPGALVHALLPPAAANICFKLIVSALFASACGAIVHRAAGMRTSLLAVTLSVFAPQIVVALHTDYVDTAVIVYATLTLACITVARNSPRWFVWIFLGGCFFAGMAVANLGSIGAPGLGIAVFHLLWARWGVKRQLACIGLYLAAVLMVIAVLGWISVRVGGDFYFLKPQVTMVHYFGTKANPWAATNWEWIYAATWLVLPVVTLLWGIRTSLAKPPCGNLGCRLIQALTAALFVSLVWALVLEIKGIGVLYNAYYASFHLCFALPLLAALCWSASDSAPSSLAWAGLLTVILVIFCFVGKPTDAWTSLVPLHRFFGTAECMPWVVAGFLLLTGLLVTLKVLPAAIRRCCRPELIVVGAIACSTPVGFHGPELSDRLRERYSLIYKTYQLVGHEFPRGKYLFWLHPDERNGMSLVSTKIWGYYLLTDRPFPALGPMRSVEKTVIIPCPPGRGREILNAATKTLAAVGFELTAPRIVPVTGDAGLGFDLASFSMLKLLIDPANPPAGMKAPVMLMDFLAAGERSYITNLGRIILHPINGDILDLSRGFPVFSPSDARDYVSTQYHMCPQSITGKTREVSIVTLMPDAGNCQCTIQDQQFHNIIRFKLNKKGREIHSADLPPDSTSLRVVFENPQATATPLPTHIQIYEVLR